VIVGADGLPELLAALEVCNQRGIEIELISSRARLAAHTAHSRTLPEDDTAEEINLQAKEDASLRDGFGERRDSLPLTPLPTRGFGAAGE
jgi:hypothetical protein